MPKAGFQISAERTSSMDLSFFERVSEYRPARVDLAGWGEPRGALGPLTRGASAPMPIRKTPPPGGRWDSGETPFPRKQGPISEKLATLIITAHD